MYLPFSYSNNTYTAQRNYDDECRSQIPPVPTAYRKRNPSTHRDTPYAKEHARAQLNSRLARRETTHCFQGAVVPFEQAFERHVERRPAVSN